MRNITLLPAAFCAMAAACSAEPASDAETAAQPAATGPANPAAAATPAPALLSPPAASAQADEAAIGAVIDSGLAGYRDTQSTKGFDFTYSPQFRRIWDRALGEGSLDHDPFCNCQDFEASKFRHRIVSLRIEGDKAVAALEIDLGFDTGEKASTSLTLIRSAKGWLLDDIGNTGLASYKADMARAEPGSYGIP